MITMFHPVQSKADGNIVSDPGICSIKPWPKMNVFKIIMLPMEEGFYKAGEGKPDMLVFQDSGKTYCQERVQFE